MRESSRCPDRGTFGPSWDVRPFLLVGAESLAIDFHDATGLGTGIPSMNQLASRFGYGSDLRLLGWIFRIEAVHRFYHPEGQDDEQITNQNFALLAGIHVPIR